MSIERKCENCIHERLNDYDTCYGCKHNAEINPNERETNPKFEEYFAPIEELVRQDERNKILETISKVCTKGNTVGFQLNGKDYLVTQSNHIDTFEEAVRREEREKFIILLKSDLENFDGLADDCVERKDIHELLQNNAVRKYIENTIELLEKGK